ncbi:Fic family protein [Inquilinus sp. CA228]|uniref:Fic family protein n=1 Tax=Inquilinus sp. CA228 TaxID=3455609 RepID=UPI003F8D819F
MTVADEPRPGEWPSLPVGDFAGRVLPERGVPAGYAAVVARHGLKAALPPRLTALALRHHPSSTPDWLMLTPRHRPEQTLAGQLQFALRWEGVDLGVLAALFRQIEPDDIAAIVRATPTGGFARRLWFLYEWLTESQLDVPDPGKVRAIPVVDPDIQYGLGIGLPSTRHKVLNNLPGTRRFCPLVRRSGTLQVLGASRLDERAREVIGRTRKDLVARAAAFLLVKDSKSSFAIEKERVSGDRATRWAQAIGQAGVRTLSLEELERLQKIVIGDARFVTLGLRDEGGFVGVHDRQTGEPVPDHISARHQDLPDLIRGMVDFEQRAIPGGLDPVIAAASLGFGFVYAHPFVDGNGRLHRWLLHHVLARAHYNPPGVPFPISSAIERRISEYQAVLESYAAEILPLIAWRPTPKGNVEVLSETADFYRYFDATAHAEFLYDCVSQTVEKDLPEEVAFLEAYETFTNEVQSIVDMPSAQVELLRAFLSQNGGMLSRRARHGEFAALTDEEAERIEGIYADVFEAR